MSAVIPSVDLHWLPTLLANSSIPIGQLGSKIALQPQINTPSTSYLQPNTVSSVPIPKIGGKLSVIQPNIISESGPGPVASKSFLQPAKIQTSFNSSSSSSSAGSANLGTSPTLNQTSAQSNIYRLLNQESPHFESEVKGGTEEVKNVGAKRNLEKEMVVATEIIEENLSPYVKEFEEIISPKGIVFHITIHTVILSALVFISLLSWFEVIRTWYDQTFDPVLGIRNVNTIFIRFWYAVFVTSIIIIIVYGLHRWSKSYDKKK